MTRPVRRRVPRRPDDMDRSDLAMCIRYAKEAVALSGSGGGDTEARQSIFHLLRHLGPLVSDLTGPQTGDVRRDWIRAIRFVDSIAPNGATRGLAVSLAEIENRIVSEHLLPVGVKIGNRNGIEKLEAMRAIVEAATQLRIGRTNAQYEVKLENIGITRQGVDKHREKLLTSHPNFHPRPWSARNYGKNPPAHVLKTALRALNGAKATAKL